MSFGSSRITGVRGHLVVAALVALLLGQTGWFAAVAGAAPDKSVIVVLKPGANPNRVAKRMGVKVRHVYRHVFTGFAGTLPAAAVAARARDPQVALLADDTRIEAASQSLPTGIDRVEADQNADASIDGEPGPTLNVDVAVLDSGIDLDHPDLNVAGGHDCTNTGSYDDDHAHGTHVAGTIAAKDDTAGVVGVAPGARLWAVKVLDSENRYGSSSVLICGLDWVVAQGDKIDVVNMSLGGGGSDGACAASPLHQAICTTVNTADIPVVVAAMNNASDAANWVPATYNEVITVSAFADFDGKPGGLATPTCASGEGDDEFAAFSNYGADIDIAAPGRCIRSTGKGGGMALMTGTSMSAPHVTGAIALYKASHPTASVAEVRAWLLTTAARPQSSPEGFGDDPDGFHEPVLYLDFDGGGGLPLDPLYPIVAHGQSTKSVDGLVAYDANEASRWVTTGGPRPRTANVWFDLGASQSITAIRWKFGKLGNADRFQIQVSDDLVTWTTLATEHNAPSAGDWQTLTTSTTGRYVRFLFKNRHDDRRLGYVSEVEVRGPGGTGGGGAADDGSGSGGGDGAKQRRGDGGERAGGGGNGKRPAANGGGQAGPDGNHGNGGRGAKGSGKSGGESSGDGDAKARHRN